MGVTWDLQGNHKGIKAEAQRRHSEGITKDHQERINRNQAGFRQRKRSSSATTAKLDLFFSL